jgi:uncharacterized protein DUF1566
VNSKTTLFVCLLSLVLFLTNEAQAQTVSNGPYYAMPAWDQTLACTTLSTCPRFIVLSNMNSEAVLDRETGLVWERSPDPTPRIWSEAHVNFQNGCSVKTVGNRNGWRLPTVQELSSLMDRTVPPPGPTLPPGHPFSNVQTSNRYWSATSFDSLAITPGGNFAYRVDFGIGNVGVGGKGALLFVWCVRGGQGVDIQG